MNEITALNLAVAEKVLGYRVVKAKPAWYPFEVWCFYAPGDTTEEWMAYSWDQNACNAMMFRNGKDDKAGTAPPLPGYVFDISAAWNVVAEIRERGLLEAFKAHLGDVWASSEEDAAVAICRAALAAVEGASPSIPPPERER